MTVEPGEVFMELTHEYPDMTVELTLFRTRIVEGRPQMLEHNDIRWLKPSETVDYSFCPADTPILEKLRAMYPG